MTALILFIRSLAGDLRSLATRLDHVESVSPTYLLNEIANCVEQAAKKALHL